MGVEGVIESDEAAPVTGVEVGHLGPHDLSDGAGVVRGAAQVLIMTEHDDAVGGQPQVCLHPLQPERGHMLDGAPGVLRNLASATTVGDDGRTAGS